LIVVGVIKMATKVHKVFVSYHHANDQRYRNRFENILTESDISVIKSVQMGDINPGISTETIRQKIRDDYLSDSAVTVVLVGAETWKRKHVDWEISLSLRDTQKNPRSGLLGIILPTHPDYGKNTSNSYIPNNPYIIPPRLHDNIQCKFAALYDWNENPALIQKWIHDAFNRRKTVNPDNSRTSFANNRSGFQWQP